jgi:hypothetical protein
LNFKDVRYREVRARRIAEELADLDAPRRTAGKERRPVRRDRGATRDRRLARFAVDAVGCEPRNRRGNIPGPPRCEQRGEVIRVYG